MDLIVNSRAVARSSLGVRRVFAGVMRDLNWHSRVRMQNSSRVGPAARVAELLQLGRRDAIFWSPTHSGPLLAHNHVVTLHDCINVEYTFRQDWRLPAFRRMFNMVLANARLVVAVSRATKDAALRNYALDESKIVVIPSGFEPPATAPVMAIPDSARPPFVLMLSNALPHKNALSACRAFAHSIAPRNGYLLRVIGTLPAGAITACGQDADKIEVHAHVADEVLRHWYQSAAFLFSPSLSEGFDLPVAEAIASGGNVLCSNIAAHREFFEGCVDFFDPCSEDAMIAALDAAIMKPEKCWFPQASSRSFRSFKDTADDYRAVFRTIEQGGGR